MRMKNSGSKYIFWPLSGLLIFLSLAFSLYYNSPVKGSVSPANGASRAWLISRHDTLSAAVIQGNFMITNVKPGNYTLMLEAKPPFRDSFKQDVSCSRRAAHRCRCD